MVLCTSHTSHTSHTSRITSMRVSLEQGRSSGLGQLVCQWLNVHELPGCGVRDGHGELLEAACVWAKAKLAPELVLEICNEKMGFPQ
jgi:hypothetical protein